MVIVADDVALRDLVARDRRRGIAGTVLVHKVAGAAAERGLPLAEVAGIARGAAATLGTMGVALAPARCRRSASRASSWRKRDRVRAGHPRREGRRAHYDPRADQIVTSLLDQIVTDLELKSGAKVALMVNGLGGTPPMELAVVSRAALADLRGRGIAVERAWSGNFMTAIEMPGVSLTVLPLDEQRDALARRRRPTFRSGPAAAG